MTAVLLALFVPIASAGGAQVVSVPALLETLGVRLDRRGAEGAFDDGVRPSAPIQPTLYPMLASVMAGAGADVRVEAAYAFGIIAGPGAPGAAPADLSLAGTALLQMIVTPDRRTRVAGARVAGRLFTTPLASDTATRRPATLVEALFSLLNASDETEQLAAMDALGRLREASAVTSLTERYAFYRQRGARALAGGAVEALARIGHSASVPLVTGLVHDQWADRDDPTGLAVAFARERLLHDGSIARIRQALDRKALRFQAQGYLDELR